MKTLLILAALARKAMWVVAAVLFWPLVLLGGCSTASQGALLKDLQGCQRHYNGVVSAGTLGVGASFSGSVKIDCPNDAGTSTPSQ